MITGGTTDVPAPVPPAPAPAPPAPPELPAPPLPPLPPLPPAAVVDGAVDVEVDVEVDGAPVLEPVDERRPPVVPELRAACTEDVLVPLPATPAPAVWWWEGPPHPPVAATRTSPQQARMMRFIPLRVLSRRKPPRARGGRHRHPPFGGCAPTREGAGYH